MNIKDQLSPLTVCIINYNGEKYLGETLNSVIIQEEYFREIILVDNSSKDNSIDFVKTNYPEIRIVQLDKNYGPASARNIAFNASSTDFILFMDNDITLEQNFSSTLLCEIKKNRCPAIVMPQVYFAGQKNRIQYNAAFCHFLGHMILESQENYLTNFNNKVANIDSVVTACFLLNRKKWGTFNPFDDSFFFNYEDHDFGLRTRIRGLDILSFKSLRCYHKEGTEGLSRREGGKYSKKRVYYLIRNRWQIILKNYQFRTIFVLLPIFFVYELFQFVGVVKKGWLIEWLKAFYWITSNFFYILRKRQLVQKTRKIADREIFKGGPVPFFKDLPQSRLEKTAKDFLDRLAGSYWNSIKGLI